MSRRKFQNPRPGASDSSLINLSAFLIVLVLGVLYLYNLGGWLINDDEGTFLYQVWRVSEGEYPYRDVFTSRWPLFLYTGAGWMRVWGAEIVPMRVLSVCMTLGTAITLFFMAQQTLPAEAALLSMVLFLLHPDAFRFGRSFQPEPFYVFFSTVGLYLFSKGQTKFKPVFFIGAGLAFAVASLYKLLAVLVVMGCVLFLATLWLRERKSRRQVALGAIFLLLPYVVLFSSVALGFMLAVPSFYESVIGFHLAQGRELTFLQVALKGIGFLIAYFFAYTPFLLLALPAARKGWAGSRKIGLFSWQLPTALAFIFLSRDLFPRLLLYLVPSLSVLFAAILEPVRLPPRRLLLLWVAVCIILVSWTMTDVKALLRREHDTKAVSIYIQKHTSPNDRVLSDYQEINFYARRPSTYSGAEISQVVIASKQYTGADLIAEIEAQDVKVVLLDISPQTGHQLVNLEDYDTFRAYLQDHFTLLDTLPRGEQRLEIYLAPENDREDDLRAD